MQDDNRYQKEYSEAGFWQKAKAVGKSAGKTVMEPALRLYYVTQSTEVPTMAKARAMAALGYFILPLDVIADLLPVIGLTDDVAVMLVAIASLAKYIDDDVRARAQGKLQEWFD